MHKPWFPHPENPERLERVAVALDEHGLLSDAIVYDAPPAREELALKIHTRSHVELIRKASTQGRVMLDSDTYVVKETFRAALAVLSSVSDGVSKALKGHCDLVLVLGRPPGHHAGRDGVAMGAPSLGFCIFNGSALASKLLADAGYRVLHVDFDLHHGNGTQDILYRDPRVVHVDLHQDPSTIYPGTGWPWQIGEGEAKGTKLNIILPPGSGDDIFVQAIDDAISLLDEQGMTTFDYIVFSAGFDAYQDDGLGMLQVTSRGFYYIAEKLVTAYQPRTVIVVWEGGYSRGLERGFPAFLAALLDEDNPIRDKPTTSSGYIHDAYRSNIHRLRSELGLI